MKPEHHATNEAFNLIEEITGIAANVQFPNDLEHILNGIAPKHVNDFIKRLKQTSESEHDWQRLISAITIGETYFMRGQTAFNILKTHILPPIILKRRHMNQLKLNVWCVGCATGEEPYSVAITLIENLPDISRWKVNILATDLNSRALEAARHGIYRKWAFRHTDETFLETYFDRINETARIKPHIRQMVTFRQGNLMRDAQLQQFDIIFCRNVMLYFHKEATIISEQRLHDALLPGGWLMLGQSEALRYKRDLFTTHIFPGNAIYQKPEQPEYAGFILKQIEPVAVVYEPDAVSPSAPPASTYKDAVDAVHEEAFDIAERHLANVLERDPLHAKAHTLLSSLFANRQASAEAQTHLDIALQYEPLLADAHYIRAMLALEDADTENTYKFLQSALYCDRNHALAAFMLGNLYAQDGNLPRAYKSWRIARQSVQSLSEDDYVSDLSDLTVARFTALLDSHLSE